MSITAFSCHNYAVHTTTCEHLHKRVWTVSISCAFLFIVCIISFQCRRYVYFFESWNRLNLNRNLSLSFANLSVFLQLESCNTLLRYEAKLFPVVHFVVAKHSPEFDKMHMFHLAKAGICLACIFFYCSSVNRRLSVKISTTKTLLNASKWQRRRSLFFQENVRSQWFRIASSSISACCFGISIT